MSARDAPAFEDAQDCSKPCLCHGCVPGLDDRQRAQAGYWLRVRCGCFVCNAGLVA